MSLKHFHLVFITASAAMFVVVGRWARAQASLGTGAVAAAGLVAAAAYLAWFLRRYRALA
jgi:hypothetical protein